MGSAQRGHRTSGGKVVEMIDVVSKSKGERRSQPIIQAVEAATKGLITQRYDSIRRFASLHRRGPCQQVKCAWIALQYAARSTWRARDQYHVVPPLAFVIV